MKAVLVLTWVILCSSCIPLDTVSAQNKIVEKKQAREVYIGIPNNRAPYVYMDEENNPRGILVEALNTMCRKSNTHCRYISAGFNQLLEKLHAQRVNGILVIDSLMLSDGKPIQMLPPLCNIQPVLIQHRNDTRKKPEDFKDAIIGVGQDSLFQLHLPDKYNNVAQLRAYPTLESAVFDLMSERLDALFTDEAFFKARVATTALSSENNPSGLVIHTISDTEFPTTSMRLVVQGKDKALLTAFEKAIQANGKTPNCTDLLDD